MRGACCWCRVALGVLLSCLAACSATPAAPPARFDYALLDSTPPVLLDYTREVGPILENRCVVCHGCYDAPCQLKLSSAAGVERGASKEIVYDGARITAAEPTRLFLDALTTDEWRGKGFHPVLAEAEDDPRQRLNGSVLYRMLELKQRYPQPRMGPLDPSIDTSLARTAACPTLAQFDDYAREHPRQGMPFALPNLDETQYQTLVHWLAQGAPTPEAATPAPAEAGQIAVWESFLNGSTPRERLVARFLYEHLFQAHLHFDGSDARSFFTLVRSRTPSGQPIQPIATRRPYGDPEGAFYYRLQALDGSIVAKDHVPYELSAARMSRLRQLFFDPTYAVSELPGYAPTIAANPFRAFAALPVQARYRFLLDDARFFVEGFIKGPVCRGQVALNVIEDRFWIFFVDPDAPLATNSQYLSQLANYLSQPTEMEDSLRLVTTYARYLELDNRYLAARRHRFQLDQPLPLQRAMDLVWNGDGQNPNAALTVFRHYDSASVDIGLVGEAPETAWVLDYPLLERIHYLLVAGFDVYGNLGHQLNTRLFMDALRMEAEDYFLALLPASARGRIRDGWYSGIRRGDAEELEAWWMHLELVTGYSSNDPQQELYERLRGRVGPLAQPELVRARAPCGSEQGRQVVATVDRALERLARASGKIVQFIPNLSFVRVRMDAWCDSDLAFTMIDDRAYENVSSMFSEEAPGGSRDSSHDRLTLVPWLEGSYPEFFFVVDARDVERFADEYAAVEDADGYERFVDHFGVRRTSARFWEASDWFNTQAQREQPERAGLFDLNRYQNR